MNFPLKRVGDRGGGKWQRISWEQALDEIAEAILKIRTISTCGVNYRLEWEMGKTGPGRPSRNTPPVSPVAHTPRYRQGAGDQRGRLGVD
ncbi:MAG: molybdopterin-dependent oxidoreductase [Chloroflexi bacterium]|nr:molybdopterin-dependent oxidoreductase [Chloroflexota bacterium]